MGRAFTAFAAIASIAAALGTTDQARATELDAGGKLRSVDPSATLIGFDDARLLASLGASLTSWRGDPWNATLVTAPIVDAAVFTGRAISEDDALEGKGAIRLGQSIGDGSTGVLIPAKGILARLGDKKRFTVTFWGRAYGTLPYLQATYGSGFVRVYALRTGRETSDGWAEFTLGTLDTDVWGFALDSLFLYLSPWASKDQSVSVDALEIVPVSGVPLAPLACTHENVDAICGPDGECQFGHCLPSWAAWGPLPPRAHRDDLVRRWIHLANRVQGDRNATTHAKALMDEGPQLATYAVGSRQFNGGIKRLVNGLRDQHTSYGSPWGSFFWPMAYGAGSWTLGACFGPGRHDLLASSGPGDLGFIVYRANVYPTTGVVLKRGDALTAIDGRNPVEWMHDAFGKYAYTLPSDPAADLGWSATALSALIARRASTIEITRCDSDTRCDGTHKQVLTIDVAGPSYDSIRKTGDVGPLPNYFNCDIRFQHAIDKFAPDVSGENKISGQIVRGDVLAIEFDGTYGRDKWSPSMRAFFPETSPPTKVLFDTRQGNGGHLNNPETVVELIRAPSEPIGGLLLPRGAWDGVDVAKLLDATRPCYDTPGGSYSCYFADVYFNLAAKPIAGSARVAFLNTANVSANDFLAKFVKGRSNLRIYSPDATSGGFGSVAGIPPLLVGWDGGSLQMQDSLFGVSYDALGAAKFESGTGVVPDVFSAETMSDAMRDRDTMIEAAHAWLAGGD